MTEPVFAADPARLLIAAAAGILLLLLLIIKFKIHPVLSLLIAALVIGLGAGMPVPTLVSTVENGAGETLQGIILLIGLGSLFGGILEVSGGAQCVATISGISRSGSTVCAGLLCGLNREYMVEYSFIMSIPVIIASALSEGKDAVSAGISVQTGPLIAGIIAALVSGIAAIKLIQWLIRKDRYKLFGYYCLAIGVLTLVLGIFGVGYIA